MFRVEMTVEVVQLQSGLYFCDLSVWLAMKQNEKYEIFLHPVFKS